MSEKDREWLPIVTAAREGESSEKRVVSSNFKHIRSIGVDDSGTGSTKISYKVRGMWRDIFAFKGAVYDTLKIPDAGRMQIEGAPEIPQEGLFVAIPENAEVKEVKIINKKENELTGEYYVLPASKPILEGEEPEHIPKKEIYESDEPFPGKDIEFIGTKHVAGRKVAHIILYLVQYKPKSKKVKALESVDLEVVYETRPGMDAKVKRRLLRKSPMEQMILDSESIIEGEKQREETEKKSNIDPPGLHDLNNEGEYLIITTADLKDSVSTLALAKENLYTVKIVTKEEILQEFSNPNEVEAIRDFLIYATANWADPPEWVVLAGDVDKIPTYITHYTTPGNTSDDLVSDHYYADLSGDLTPEIVVSRLPASNAQDMERICSIAASYGETGGGWRNKILLTAYQSTGYINCNNEIASLIGTDFEVIKKYAGQSSKQEVIATLNAGVVIANYRGHGSKTAWSASNGLNASDVGNLTNDDKIPFVFSIACWNNCIDMAGECFGETWIRNEKAITFLGASRPSFTSPNHDFDEYLFDAIITQGLTKVGDIVNWAKTKLFQNYPGSLAEDNIRMYLLFGEPTVDIKENETGIIKGEVVDKFTNNPVEDARVSTGTISKMTKSDGTYELRGVPIGERLITAIKACYKDAETSVTVKKGEVVTANTLELEEALPDIKGKVVYKTTNEPVESARISTDTGQSAMTGSDGTYELCGVPEGDRVVTAIKTGCKCACAFVTVKEGEVAPANFELCDSPPSRATADYTEGTGKFDQKPPAKELTDNPIPPEVSKAKADKVAARVAALRKEKTVLIINGDNNPYYEDDQSVLTFMSAFQNMGDEVRVEQAKDTSSSTWSSYDIVVWSCGDDYSAINDDKSKRMLVDYVAKGGRLLLESGNVAAWIREFGGPVRELREKVLHATKDWVYHDVGDLTLKTRHPVATTPNILPETIGFTPTTPGDYSGDANAVRILPDATGIYGWSYVAYGGKLVNKSVESKSCGLIAYDAKGKNGGRIIYYAFDIDDIDSPDIQQKLIQNSRDWLKPKLRVTIITGEVVDKFTNKPVEGAKIYTDTGHTMTRSDGTYELCGVPEGDRVVTAIKTGCKCACAFVIVKEGEVATANFELCNGPT